MRLIKAAPVEWRAKCPYCGAVMAYTEKDVWLDSGGSYDPVHAVGCIGCNKAFRVPTCAADRRPIEGSE